MNPANGSKRPGALEAPWLRLESFINGVTGPVYNPFYYLGAVCIIFLGVILCTGVYLFIFYSISASGAYASVEAITHRQWRIGGVMRSLHRYSADGLIAATLLHTMRCFFLDRYRNWRWIAWVSGVVIAWVIVIGGIFGYWMVWDERAKLVAALTARLIENIPIFGLPLSLNFARAENLTDQLFYIILFIHFSTAFFIFILTMVHIGRITKAVIMPPKAVSYGIIAALLGLSILKPALSGQAAALKTIPSSIPFDWFFMFIFPLLKSFSPRETWLVIAALTALFTAAPWLSFRKRSRAAVVTLKNCTGCELCMEDCPYQAIRMRKRTDALDYPLEAVVYPARCASCGLCAGACDYNAINLPDMTEDAVKERIRGLSGEIASEAALTVMVFSCAKGPRIDDRTLKGLPWARSVEIPCIGMLQPSMLSIPFECGVDAVFVSGCREGDCSYRTGNDWFSGRLSGVRPPVVKRSIDRTMVRAVWNSSVEKGRVMEALRVFQKSIVKGGAGVGGGEGGKS